MSNHSQKYSDNLIPQEKRTFFYSLVSVFQIPSLARSEIENWIDLYSDELLSWAEYRLGDRDLAQDLVQESFLAAYEKMDSFKGESSPKTWLSRILRNKITDHFRSAYYRRNVFDAAEEESGAEEKFFNPKQHWQGDAMDVTWDDSEALMDQPEFALHFKKCLDHLPSLWRDIIAAKYFGESTGAEISKEFDISTSNYWQIIHRAKLSLKNCIEVFWQS